MIAYKLASQHINLIIVGLNDDQMANSKNKFLKEFPDVDFCFLGVDLSENLEPVFNIIKEKQPNALFNCAGFMSMLPVHSPFYQSMIESYLKYFVYFIIFF